MRNHVQLTWAFGSRPFACKAMKCCVNLRRLYKLQQHQLSSVHRPEAAAFNELVLFSQVLEPSIYSYATRKHKLTFRI